MNITADIASKTRNKSAAIIVPLEFPLPLELVVEAPVPVAVEVEVEVEELVVAGAVVIGVPVFT